jgi:hypothetical protein
MAGDELVRRGTIYMVCDLLSLFPRPSLLYSDVHYHLHNHVI